jgi:nucleoside-diphosphate-sugar epimerase
MKILVTGSSGHLGEALVRTLRDRGNEVIGLDVKASAFTTKAGSVADRLCVRDCMAGVEAVFHAATLHKPHVETHSMQEFVDTNVSGTLALLEEAKTVGVKAFVFTSTTSLFGDALRPPAGTPAAWVTEDIRPIPKNIYGTTKTAAEDDDEKSKRENYGDSNAKANEFLFRRVELEDVVSAHMLAGNRAAELGFGRYIISATTPFLREDLLELNTNAPDVVRKRVPDYLDIYQERGWKMFDRIDRVYVNEAARKDLGWEPKYDFAHVLECLRADGFPRSPISKLVGSKGYHEQEFEDGPYPVQ